MKKITLIDYIILGLLNQASQTGYGIRKTFETTALGDFSSSPGSIYPAINRLKSQKLVRTVDGSNLLELTSEGISALRDWLLQPIKMEEVRKSSDHLILRFALMDKVVDRKDREEFIQAFIRLVRLYLEELDYYHEQHAETMPLTGRLAFEHGLESYQASLSWARKALKQLKKKDK